MKITINKYNALQIEFELEEEYKHFDETIDEKDRETLEKHFTIIEPKYNFLPSRELTRIEELRYKAILITAYRIINKVLCR